MYSSGSRSWFSIINESVHTIDDQDIGNVYGVSRFFLVVKRGIFNLHYYYIPLNKIEGRDGNILWLKISEEHVKNNYERDRTPDSLKYHMKEHPNFSFSLSPLPLIPSKKLRYEKESSESSASIPRVYDCPLCNQVFKTQDDLGAHIQHVAH